MSKKLFAVAIRVVFAAICFSGIIGQFDYWPQCPKPGVGTADPSIRAGQFVARHQTEGGPALCVVDDATVSATNIRSKMRCSDMCMSNTNCVSFNCRYETVDME